MCALTTPKDFIVKANVHKVVIVVMQTPQVTQATSFPKAKAKIILDIRCDDLPPSIAIILSIHALHLQRPMRSWKHEWQFENDISIESSRQEMNFLKRYLVIIQILQLVEGMLND
jgi:hypothetical protein